MLEFLRINLPTETGEFKIELPDVLKPLKVEMMPVNAKSQILPPHVLEQIQKGVILTQPSLFAMVDQSSPKVPYTFFCFNTQQKNIKAEIDDLTYLATISQQVSAKDFMVLHYFIRKNPEDAN